MNIICSTDDNFIQHCSIMLTSVLTNNQDVIVWVLSEGLNIINYNILKNEIETKGGVFNYVKVDSNIIDKLPMPKNLLNSHISPATYYRILMSDILSPDINKVIYLDCDIIVRGSLLELWNTDISKFAIGAVHQMYNEIEDAIRLNYPLHFGYFNAGVLLVNLDYWRKYNITEKLFKYLIDNYSTILMHDQDALNAILYDKAYKLPCKWNMLYFFFLPYSLTIQGIYDNQLIDNYSEYKKQLINNRKNPIVIHYVSKPKPWQKGCVHPFSKEYYIYAKRTNTFCNIKEPNWFLKNIEIKIINTHIFFKWVLRPIYQKFRMLNKT